MSNQKLYQETFSQVRSTTVIDWDSMEKKPKRNRFTLRRGVMLAAVVGLLAVFSTVAAADRWFGLRSLELEEEVTLTQPDGEEVTVSVPTGTISLQGFDDTPESKALGEWKNFLANYDDGGALERIGNSPSGFEEEYGLYLIYTQEMADKFEEILAKYGLKKHTVSIDLYPAEELCAQVGGDFLGENHAYIAYMYEDGTFAFDGDIDLPGYGLLDYQFMRCVRGSFTDVMLNIGYMKDYTEWTYTTACGIPVTLALSPSKGLVLVDLPDSFVTINVLAGEQMADPPFSTGAISREQLEQFADTFDFSVLTPALPADFALEEAFLEEEAKQEAEESAAFYLRTGLEEAEAQRFYGEFRRLAKEGDRQAVAERIFYPAWVTVDGEPIQVHSPEEFLPYYDAIFTESLWESIETNQYTEERADLVTHDGMVGAADGFIWFALTADGETGIMTIQNEEGTSIRHSLIPGITAG